jgi:tetratricopeptide (TPR) repeat protein
LLLHTKIGGGRLGRCALALLAALALSATACARGGDLEQQLSELRSLQDEGKAAETLDALSELARLHPDNEEVSFRLGLAMVAVGRPTEAIFPLHKAAESDEFAVPAGIVLASTLAQTSNHAESLRAADHVLEREKDNEAALLLRAAAAVELHDGNVALETADRLVEKAPDNRTYRFVRASALAESDRLDEAEKLYRELLNEDAEGQPQSKTKACTLLARFYLDKRKDTERAVKAAKDCVEENPEDLEMVTTLGAILEQLERRDDLIELLEKAIEKNPDSPKLREAVLDQLVKADRLDQAKERTEAWIAKSDDSPSWRQAAMIRRRSGDLAGALEAVEKAISLSPTPEDELRFFRVELLIELGRLDEAEKLLDTVEGKLYKDVLVGRLAQERGDPKRALELYGKASIEWPQNFGLRVLAARAAFALGDTERAKSDLLEATRQAPKDTDAALWLARIFYAEGNFGQCAGFAQRQLKERGTVDAGAHVIWAEALAATNQMPQALKVLESLAKERDGEFRSIAWATEANLRARGAPGEALKDLEARIASAKLDLGDPKQEVVLDQIFDLLVQTGHADAAEKRVAGLLVKRPDSAHLYALAARGKLAQGQVEAAEQDFQRALELQPKEALALSGLALVHQRKGDLGKAIELMNQASEAAPDSSDYAYMAASLTFQRGDRAAAREKYESVLRAHPDSASSANDLAFLLAEDSTDLPRALQLAERAVRLKPSAETLDTLGYVKLRQGAAEEAVGMFERALSRQPDYATARFHLGLALIEKGEPQAAKQALQEALSHSFPEEQEARKVLARIDSGEARP